MMPIHIDADQDAGGLRHLAIHVVQIEPHRIGVEFQEAAALPRMRDHARDVDVVWLALQKKTPRGVGKNRRIPVVQRLQHARGLLFAGQVEFAVDGNDDQVEFREDRIVEIERAVFQDVALGALEQAEILEAHRFSSSPFATVSRFE